MTGKKRKEKGEKHAAARRHPDLFSFISSLFTPGRGFSLMEAITVIGIMTMVLVMVDQVFAVSYDVFVKQAARTDNETGAVLATRNISDLARGASAVEASATVDGTAYVTSSSILVLKMPTVDASNDIVSGSYDYIAFYRDGSDATKIYSDTEAATGSKRLTGKKLVTANNLILTFRYNDPDVSKASRVQVYLVNTQTKRATTLTTKAWTSIHFRNY